MTMRKLSLNVVTQKGLQSLSQELEDFELAVCAGSSVRGGV
jgi:hypothetical protein